MATYHDPVILVACLEHALPSGFAPFRVSGPGCNTSVGLRLLFDRPGKALT
jgi:hypothetical protein